jgi:aspartate/methionine/tyrosine aminotransferase
VGLSAQSLLAAVSPPPIAEAQTWIASRTFPSQMPLIDLCQAVPGYPPPDELLAHLAGALKLPATHRYTDITGLRSLRTALASDINRTYAPGRSAVTREHVLVTAGCNQAYSLTASAIAKAGDEVILPLPYYFNHRMWLDMIGVAARHVAFRPATLGLPDLNDIQDSINARTRALVLISPNNPTGAVYPAAYLKSAFDLCKDAGIALVLDETYRDFMPDDAAPHDLFQCDGWEGTLIHLYSFSKVFCLTGYRVGAIVGDPALLSHIAKAMDCVAICAPHVGQIAAEWGLQSLDAWRRGNASLMRARLGALRSALARDDVGYQTISAGAYFAYVKHPHAGRNSQAVARRLADRQNLLALPGSMFGQGQEQYLRLAFANVDASSMPEIAARLAADAADRGW